MDIFQHGEGLTEVLERVLPDFEQQLVASWSVPQFSFIREALVPAYLAAARTMVQPPGPDNDRVRWRPELLSMVNAEDDIWVLPYFELEMAKELQRTARVRSARMAELVSLAIADQPSEAVMKYLRRACVCYAAGFDAETVIMCRAVIDTAVRDVVRTSRVRCHPDASMRQRLAALRASGRLSLNAQNAAWTVWIRGNKAVHEDPDVTRDAMGTLRLTMAALVECIRS